MSFSVVLKIFIAGENSSAYVAPKYSFSSVTFKMTFKFKISVEFAWTDRILEGLIFSVLFRVGM